MTAPRERTFVMLDLIALSWKHIAALVGFTVAFAVVAAPDLSLEAPTKTIVTALD